MPSLTRRRALLSALPAATLCACSGHAQEPQNEFAPVPPLKMVAPFPVGVCISTVGLQDPTLIPLVLANCAQLTAEWQMKMETILQADGSYAFDRPDQIVDFAGQNGLRMHGHTLIWYAQKPVAFERIDGNRPAFQNAYQNYIAAVAGRYRGRLMSWDVVNEPVSDEGGTLRECLWSRNLGQIDYIIEAFHLARQADDQAILFLNDYWLEKRPEKRRAFMRLVEQLLKAGAPLGGIGTQTHLDITLDPASLAPAMQDLASFGLPIHVSELDVSTRIGRFDLSSPQDRSDRQARLVHAVVEAFMRLPPQQRFAMTLWGLRDGDSWLQKPPNPKGVDKPLLFDDAGRPKPAAAAFVAALAER
jgi:endo-1,4-beta-xylanase